MSSGSVPASDIQAVVDYYARKRLYRHICNAVDEYTSHSGHDATVSFWKGFALSKEGRHSDAIRELEPLQGEPGIALSVTAALLATHKASEHRDRDAISALKQQLKRDSATQDVNDLLFAGRYFLHDGRFKQAKKCIEKAHSRSSSQTPSLEQCVAEGWLRSHEVTPDRAFALFEDAVAMSEGQDLGALLGHAQCLERQGRFEDALEDYNRVYVHSPHFSKALVEKARVFVVLGNWSEATDLANRALKANPHDFDAVQVLILYLLARESRPAVAAQRARELHRSMQSLEPSNGELLYTVSRMVSRLSSRNREVLTVSMEMIQNACKIDSLNALFLTERAAQHMLLHDYDTAIQLFSEASQLDDTNQEALLGRIHCKIMQREYEQAEQQLQFLAEVHDGLASQQRDGGNAMLLYMEAIILWRHHNQEAEAMRKLSQCMDAHLAAVSRAPSGFEFYVAFDPIFVVDLANEFLQHVGSQPPETGETPHPMLRRVSDLLERLTAVTHGIIDAQLLLARTYFLSGELALAERVLRACFRLDSQFAAAHILQAQVSLAKGSLKQARQALEQAMSFNFTVRNTPQWYYLRARLLDEEDCPNEALKLLKAAMNLPGVRRASDRHSWSLSERIQIFILTAHMHAKLGHVPEAVKVMQDARHEFEQSAEFGRVLLADADMQVLTGNASAALKVLASIRPGSVYYTRAKVAMADVFLKVQRNRKLFIACYEDMAKRSEADMMEARAKPGDELHSQAVRHYVMLGEAFMRIQEPSKAIGAYERALRLEPDNAELSSKIGSALVMTHDYARAVTYYVAALSTLSEAAADDDEDELAEQGDEDQARDVERARMHRQIQVRKRRFMNKLPLVIELGELYLMLKDYASSVRLLNDVLDEASSPSMSSGALPTSATDGGAVEDNGDIPMLKARVQLLQLLSRVYEGARDTDRVEESLRVAFDLEQRLMVVLRSRDPDDYRVQKQRAADLCYKLAMFFKDHRHNNRMCQQYLDEAIKLHPRHEKALLALVKVHLHNERLDDATTQCLRLLDANSNHPEAAMLLAETLLRKQSFEDAALQFQAFLDKNPCHYKALSTLIRLLRRAGQLKEAEYYLRRAERSSARAKYEAGYNFCNGLYHRYSGDPRQALHDFNSARKDGAWGTEAIINMVEIYINPDNSALFQESTDAEGDHRSEHVVHAEMLLQEIMVSQDPRYVVLECYVKMATKQKKRIEDARAQLMTLLKENNQYAPATLALANAHLLLKQTPKARNRLRVLSKTQVDMEYYDEYEQAWLMLAQLYIDSGKYDLATTELRRVLHHNKSSAKAYEMLGVINEKEKAYNDAAQCYENAWSATNESSPAIGYRLAFNYLKDQRWLPCIDVCHKVLRQFPDYPKIDKLMKQAREGLRN